MYYIISTMRPCPFLVMASMIISTMRPCPFLSFFFFFFLLLLFSSLHVPILYAAAAAAASSNHVVVTSTEQFRGYTGISDFRLLNRKLLEECPFAGNNRFLSINVSSISPALMDEENVTVTVSGVLHPDKSDWIAMISSSHSSISACPLNSLLYKETGDFSNLPLLCHYPVKAQYMHSDPSYLDCKKKECRKQVGGVCLLHTCSASLTFHVVNFRTDVEFVLFSGGFVTPCMLKRSSPIAFSNPKMPLHGRLSSVDSTGTSMKLTWTSGDSSPQQVFYGNGKSATSQVATFTNTDMCGGEIPSPATDFGWHDPGYIHSAVMTGLKPSTAYSYKYGSNTVGWSNQIMFKTPPAAGSQELVFLAYGDMGKAPLDQSTEHYIQPGSLSVVDAVAGEVASGKIDSIFHIGDISYATGFLVEWDYFLKMIEPVASHIPYMTAIGNHERDHINSGSIYPTPDSGGECGVPYETYFPMPTAAKDKPWYSIEQASVHFTVISTEHACQENSEQYQWIKKDLASVDRTRTPWVIFTGHRPMYSSQGGILPSVDPLFVDSVEPLLMDNKVDLALFGHVHNYERTCAVYRGKCKGTPTKDTDGIDTYDSNNYSAPVHVVIGMAGFSLDRFGNDFEEWSLSRISEFGYVKIHATRKILSVQLVNSNTRNVRDQFQITKGN